MRSIHGDIVITGTQQRIEKAWESLAYEAQRDNNEALAHLYFQQAEHYKKSENNSK